MMCDVLCCVEEQISWVRLLLKGVFYFSFFCSQSKWIQVIVIESSNSQTRSYSSHLLYSIREERKASTLKSSIANCHPPVHWNLVLVTELNTAIWKYKRKKQQRVSSDTIVKLSSEDILLSVNIPREVLPPSVAPPVFIEAMPSVLNNPPPIVASLANLVVQVDDDTVPHNERAPAAKKSWGCKEFTASFSKSYKDFDNLADKEKNVKQKKTIGWYV